MRFNFSIYYLPGRKMHIADILSRLAGKDLDPPDRVIPISFNAMQSVPPPLRRSPRIKSHQDQKSYQQPTPQGPNCAKNHNLRASLPRLPHPSKKKPINAFNYSNSKC